MKAITKAQQEIIDVLTGGGSLRVFEYTRGPSVWKLSDNKDRWVFGKTVKDSTVNALVKRGMIKVVQDRDTYPRETYVELANSTPAR